MYSFHSSRGLSVSRVGPGTGAATPGQTQLATSLSGSVTWGQVPHSLCLKCLIGHRGRQATADLGGGKKAELLCALQSERYLEDVAASSFRGKAASPQMSGRGWEAAEKGKAEDLSWKWMKEPQQILGERSPAGPVSRRSGGQAQGERGRPAWTIQRG